MRRIWPFTVRGTGALVLALACFIAANEIGVVELLYFGMLLLAALGTSVVSLHLTRRSERVERTLSPEVASVGDDSRVSIRVTVRSAVSTPPGTWDDALPKALRGTAHGDFPALRSGLRRSDQSVDMTYTITGERRGVHALGPLTVRTTDPFGLARRQRLLGSTTRIAVAPAVVELPALAEFAGEAGGALQTVNTQLGQGADNLIARPYASGDSMRRIHWRATAHRDELMVRQEEQESTPEATVILDRGVLRFSPDALHSPGADPAFEAAVSACVSVVARLVKDGYAVEVIDTDGAVLGDRIDGGESAEVEELVHRFATLVARRDDFLTRLPQLFAGVTTGPVILIVGRFDPQDADAIAAAAHHSTLPVLFAVAPVTDALERAESVGWRAGEIGIDSDLATAWSRTVTHGAGAGHAF